MLLIALHFASCLSALTLLTGESWRVRYALIRCFAILHRPASDGRIRKTSVQPARLSGQMALHHLPSHPQEADVRGSRSLRGIWKMSGPTKQPWTVDLPPSHPFSPLFTLIPQASAQLDPTSGHISRHLEHTALKNE